MKTPKNSKNTQATSKNDQATPAFTQENHESNKPQRANSGSVPTLSSFIDFAIPPFEIDFDNRENGYLIACDEEHLEKLKSAVFNSKTTVSSSIEALGDVLSHIGMFGDIQELREGTITGIGEMLRELSLCNNNLDNLEYIINHATISK